MIKMKRTNEDLRTNRLKKNTSLSALWTSGRGRGPPAASYREAMTKMTMGGAEVQNANGVRTKSHGQPTLAPKAEILRNTPKMSLKSLRSFHFLLPLHQ